jgi:hypothetical protein
MVVEVGMGIVITMVTVAVRVDESWRWTVETLEL